MNCQLNQAQGILSAMGIVDGELDVLVRDYGPEVDREVDETLAKARESNTFLFHLSTSHVKLNLFTCRFILPKMEGHKGAYFPH
jgi:hypothetical protein